MIELKEKPKCCSKDMHKSNKQNLLSDADTEQYVCLVCGSYITVTEGQLDEEELENFKENYEV